MHADLFRDRYRFVKEIVLEMCHEIFADLKHPTLRNHSSTVALQVCTALRFFAQGTYLSAAGDITHISKKSAARCVDVVSSKLCEVLPRYVGFPPDIAKTKNDFYNYCRFPRIIGVIDGTHVSIIRPTVNEAAYINRKSVHSINVMYVCGSNMQIYNCVARFPGGCHDAFVLHSSNLCAAFDDNEPDGWLLGDTGYPCKRWLLTPLENPVTDNEHLYQRRHKRGRCIIERCNGLIKERFRCLLRQLYFTPEKACKIICACVVLHNIAIATNQHFQLEEVNDPIDANDIQGNDYNFNVLDVTGNAVRQHLINNLH